AVQVTRGGSKCIDDHTGGVRGIPNLQLVLQGNGSITEVATFQTDEGPLAVIQPGNVIGWSNVDVIGVQFGFEIGGHGLGFGDLFGLQAFAFQHVLEVHVATHVELVSAVNGHAAGLEQCGQGTVGNGGTNLGFDVVTNNGHTGVGKFLCPGLVRGDEHR